MSVHLQREIERLKNHVLSLCTLVEEQVQRAVRALLERDEKLAREVERRDLEIDQREVEVEEECLKTLALYEPVAIDLRLVISILKINNDLERIGDLAVNIARKAASYAAEPLVEIPFDIPGMWEKTHSMLRDSIEALVQLNAKLAVKVCAQDNEVDLHKHQIRIQVEEAISRDPQRVRPLLRLLAVSRNLERIADCATNIAEDVIYMAEGKIIRHGKENLDATV